MDLICPKMPISTIVKKNIFLKKFWDLGTPDTQGLPKGTKLRVGTNITGILGTSYRFSCLKWSQVVI